MFHIDKPNTVLD